MSMFKIFVAMIKVLVFTPLKALNTTLQRNFRKNCPRCGMISMYEKEEKNQ